MLSGVLGILFIISSTLFGFTAKQNYVLSRKYNRLQKSVTDNLMLDASLSNQHNHIFKRIGCCQMSFDNGSGGQIEDVLESSKCTQCHLIKRYWLEGGVSNIMAKMELPLDGLFKFSTRLDALDAKDVPCVNIASGLAPYTHY